MRAPRPTTIAVLLVAWVALLPAGNALASGKDVIRDCTDDEVLSKTYTQKEYAAALAQLSGDTDEYGDCRDIIRRAQLAALHQARAARNGSHGGGTSGGGTAGGGSSGGGQSPSAGFGSPPAKTQLDGASAAERKAVHDSARAPRAVDLQGVAVNPGLTGSGNVPTPLVVLLALVLAGALALSGTWLRARVRTHRSA